MDNMEKTTARNLLLDKCIILKSGAICQDKINLISGAMTTPLIETIWIFSGHDAGAMKRISAIFAQFIQREPGSRNDGCTAYSV